MRIDESLHCQSQGYKNMIAFSNSSMSDQVRNWVSSVFIVTFRNSGKVQFNILHDIGENFTLV